MRKLYLCGDIHGEWRKFVFTAVEQKKIECADIIILGDFGVGFDGSIKYEYERTKKRLEKHDLRIWVVRGNHDDPGWFDGAEEHDFPRLKFLKDHEAVEICGHSVYPIGGANSVDVEWRRQEQKWHKNPIWWENEGPVMQMKGLPPKVDIVVSHCAPLAFLPVISRFPDCPKEQYDKILGERKYLNHVLHEIRTQYWFYGHYHEHYADTYGETKSYGLGIMEIFECPEVINVNPQDDNVEP